MTPQEQIPPSSNDFLELATEALRGTPVPAIPAEAIARAERIPTTIRHRQSMRIPLRLLAACAAILLLTLTIYFLVQRSSGIAFADVVQNIARNNTFTATIEGSAPDPVHLSVKGQQMRNESNERIIITNQSSGKTLFLYPSTHRAWLTLESKVQNVDFYSELVRTLGSYHAGSEKLLGEKVIHGQRVQGFEISNAPFFGEKEDKVVFWADPATKLPLEIDMSWMVLKDIHFDVPLDDALFDMTIPAGYALSEDLPADPNSWDQFKYVGQVVDEQGKPIAGVGVLATYHTLDGGMGYITDNDIRTDQFGRFNIDVPDRARSGLRSNRLNGLPVWLEFTHPDYLYGRLEDVHLLSPELRSDLHIRLRHGKNISGRVIDSAGRPVAGALVQSIFGKPDDLDDDARYDYRKAILSDADGKFELHSLPTAVADVQAFRLDGSSPILSGHAPVDLQDAPKPVEITVQPYALPPSAVVHELFGMKFVDMDKEMQDRLFLYFSQGALILDPGHDSERLNIGHLHQGNLFFLVGEHGTRHIKDFNDFAQQLLAACEEQSKAGRTRFSVRVVYDWIDVNSQGSNTQHMTLNEADLAELRAVVKR